MTRAEQLEWWRQGYEAGLAAGSRQRHDQELAFHRAAVAEFHAQHRAGQQAVVDAQLLDVIDVLARALLGEAHTEVSAA